MDPIDCPIRQYERRGKLSSSYIFVCFSNCKLLWIWEVQMKRAGIGSYESPPAHKLCIRVLTWFANVKPARQLVVYPWGALAYEYSHLPSDRSISERFCCYFENTGVAVTNSSLSRLQREVSMLLLDGGHLCRSSVLPSTVDATMNVRPD